MTNKLICTVVVVSAFLALPVATYGQGGTTSTLAGVVVDSSGGVIPGADVVAKHNATGVTVSAVTNSDGVFSFLPLTSRSAMDFVPFMPGVATANGNRQSIINGLPRGTINITLDGVNIQDNTLRSTDGFFAIVAPRLDAIDEVTVQTAAQGADSGGQGAVQVKFVTRSGTNNYTGSGYYYYRNDSLTANTWFNNRNGHPKPALLRKQAGVRLGGPILRRKAFFFFN